MIYLLVCQLPISVIFDSNKVVCLHQKKKNQQKQNQLGMPYNVITLTGTVIALFFGTILNALTNRMKHLDKVGDEYVSNRPIAKFLRFIINFFNKE